MEGDPVRSLRELARRGAEDARHLRPVYRQFGRWLPFRSWVAGWDRTSMPQVLAWHLIAFGELPRGGCVDGT